MLTTDHKRISLNLARLYAIQALYQHDITGDRLATISQYFKQKNSDARFKIQADWELFSALLHYYTLVGNKITTKLSNIVREDTPIISRLIIVLCLMEIECMQHDITKTVDEYCTHAYNFGTPKLPSLLKGVVIKYINCDQNQYTQ